MRLFGNRLRLTLWPLDDASGPSEVVLRAWKKDASFSGTCLRVDLKVGEVGVKTLGRLNWSKENLAPVPAEGGGSAAWD